MIKPISQRRSHRQQDFRAKIRCCITVLMMLIQFIATSTITVLAESNPCVSMAKEHNLEVPATPTSTLVNNYCICLDGMTCLGPSCQTGWVRHSYANNVTAEFITGYQPQTCKTCTCDKTNLSSLTRVSDMFHEAIQARLRKLSERCAYAYRVMKINSLQSNPESLREYFHAAINGNVSQMSSDGPTFIVIGAQKAGTTEAWVSITNCHEFSKPRKQGAQWAEKELHFWDGCLGVHMARHVGAKQLAEDSPHLNHNWCDADKYLGMIGYGNQYQRSWYYKDDPNHVLYPSEASPSYMIFPELAILAGTMLPEAKFVAMIRDPVQRAFSGYHQSHTGFQKNDGTGTLLSFDAAVEREISIIRQCELLFPDPSDRYSECIWPWFATELLEDSLESDWYMGSPGFEHKGNPRKCSAGVLRKQSIVTRGLYYYQIKYWLDSVGKDRFHIMLSEDYFNDPVIEIESILRFVSNRSISSCPKRPDPLGKFRNSKSAGQKMNPDTEKRLKDLYAPYNRLLVNLLREYDYKVPLWANAFE